MNDGVTRCRSSVSCNNNDNDATTKQKRRSRSNALSRELADSNLQGDVTIFYLLFSANIATQVSNYRNLSERKSFRAKRNSALAKFRPAEFLQQPRSTDFLVKVFENNDHRKSRKSPRDDPRRQLRLGRRVTWLAARRRSGSRQARSRFFFSRARA